MAKKEEPVKGAHIHGCGHPVRPVILCDNPLCLLFSEYLDWKDEHSEAEAAKQKCICYFCWKAKRK